MRQSDASSVKRRPAHCVLATMAPALAAGRRGRDPDVWNSGDTAWMLTVDRAGAVHDHPGPGAVLWRHGARQERAVGADAVLRDHRAR
ncbi:MAG: hypothetical protein MZV65_40325 [Chromatiales bacterium]|nr:hypothetical protein [Chromatiales bacterium]